MCRTDLLFLKANIRNGFLSVYPGRLKIIRLPDVWVAHP